MLLNITFGANKRGINPKITRHTIGAHGYNLLQKNYLMLSCGITCCLKLHMVPYRTIAGYFKPMMLFQTS